MKLHITRAKRGEFDCEVEPDSLTADLRDVLRLSHDHAYVLKGFGTYDVEVDDPSDHIAYAMVDSLTIVAPDGTRIDVRLDDKSFDNESLDCAVTDRIDWGDYFADYAASRADWEYDRWKDSQDE